MAKERKRKAMQAAVVTGISPSVTSANNLEPVLTGSNPLLDTILEHTRMMAVYLDTRFNFVWVNRAYADTCKHDQAFFVGKNHFELYPHPENQAIFQRVVDSAKPFFVTAKPFEFSDQPARGVTYWDWGLIPVKDAAGKTIGLVFTLADVTGHKLAEEDLQLSKQRLSLHVEQTPLAVIEFDTGGQVQAWNPAASAMFGYSREEAVGQYWTFIVPVAIHGQLEGVWAAIVGQRGGNRSTNENITKDGRTISCEWFNTPLVGSDGRIIGVASLIQDVTERKQAEKALEESRRRYQEVVEATTAGIWDWNIQTGIVIYSQSWITSLGYTSAEVPPSVEFWKSIVHPDDLPRVLAAVQSHIEGRVPVYEVENRLRLKSGEYRYNFACGKVVERDADGDPLRMVGTDTDITERKQTEDVLAFLGQHGGAASSQGFLKLLAQYLAEKLGMDFVCIDRLEGDGLTARTVAVWCDGKFDDNVTYALKDTPCGDVVGKSVCCFPASVCRYFPKDVLLKDLKAESYVGVTLWGHEGKPIGLIAVIGRKPLVNRPLAETMLKTVAVRAGAELERLAAEASLRESELKYRLLTESIQDVVWTLDTRTMRFIYISPSVQNLRGFTPEEILASPIHAALTPQDGELIKERIQQRAADFLSGKEPPDRFYTNEIEQPCKDGSTVWTEAVTSYYRNEKTGAVEVRGVTRNIAARKRVEEQLRMREVHLQSIIESTADGILAVDNNGKVVKANRRFAELWRIPPSLMEESADQALLEFVMSELSDPEAFLKKVQALYKSDAVDMDTLLFKDGRVFERVSTPMMMDGAVAGRVWSFRDVTVRNQAEEALRQKITELELFNDLTVDRELKMIELKKEINGLLRAAGRPEKYKIAGE